MQISKAVVTAAGRDHRALPLQTLVDQDGKPKSALEIILAEAFSAGVEELAVVVFPGDESAFADAAGEQAGRLTFIPQKTPRGYGHALWCARDFLEGQPFLHMVSDHLSISDKPGGCAQQLMQVAQTESCTVSAVQPTRENTLHHYGTVGGRPVPGVRQVYQVETVLEKPTPTQAEQELMVPGLRAGHYLCFFGMHILTPSVIDLIGEDLDQADQSANVQLSPALARLAKREKFLALGIEGHRYNIGIKYGLFMAQLALAMNGSDREEVLAQMLELMAQRELERGA